MCTGKLYIVSTPIGNLEDITFRAVNILKQVDMIAAEDTRKARILLDRYDIKKPLTSYFEHNEQQKTGMLLKRMKDGEDIAVISEAGTPCISDPGYRLVHKAIEESIPVIPVPGPCAAIAALSVSGLPVHRFAFEGFLPPRKGKRKTFLKNLSNEKRTMIFYESPYRIVSAIKDMLEILGDRPAMFARELTKFYEESIPGTLSTILQKIETKKIKGEITLIVKGNK